MASSYGTNKKVINDAIRSRYTFNMLTPGLVHHQTRTWTTNSTDRPIKEYSRIGFTFWYSATQLQHFIVTIPWAKTVLLIIVVKNLKLRNPRKSEKSPHQQFVPREEKSVFLSDHANLFPSPQMFKSTGCFAQRINISLTVGVG